MQISYCHVYLSGVQNKIYEKLNACSSNETLCRLASLPISVADIGIDLLKTPGSALEHLALSIKALSEVIFSESSSLEKSLCFLDSALCHIMITPIKTLGAPLKIIWQTFSIIRAPESVKRFGKEATNEHLENIEEYCEE